MQKLYSIKEITQILNEQLAESGVDYRYTEERVRARLRYLRSKETQEAESLHVEPKVYGYDRRAKYYTDEDVQKLKSIWIGPMLPEFTEHASDAGGNDVEREEIEIREAKSSDALALNSLVSTIGSDFDFRGHIVRLLKESQGKVFIAFIPDDSIIGWAQAEVSSALTLIEGVLSGFIRVYVPQDRADKHTALRLLIYRAQWWLKRQDVQRIVAEVPKAFINLTEDTYLEDDPELMIFRFANPS